ncbi:MAG: response regulator [Chitinophagaceae bacterium]
MKEKDANSTTALIVDDEVDICYLLKGILRYKNIAADYVNNLTDAEKFLQSHNPPVIFLDNRLSDGFGINHIRRIKQEHPTSKIIMITAHDTPADRQKAYEEGVDFFIGKPFTKEAILTTIEKINL